KSLTPPTMREDLADIIRMSKKEGFEHVQLNTNGIKIGNDFDLFKKLSDAGVGVLYLSFDGVSKKTNPKNHGAIPKVLENSRKTKNMNIVLVPTVIGGVNDFEVGDTLDFALQNNDVVKGINYQPVSLVGRMPRKQREEMRVTIPDVIKRIEKHTNGEVGRGDFYPIPYTGVFSDFIESLTGKAQYDLSTHFACGMGTYVFRDGERLVPITRFVDVDGLSEFLKENTEGVKNSNKVLFDIKLVWKLKGFIDNSKKPKWLDMYRLLFDTLVKHDYSSLGRLHSNSLFIGMMHFMDLYNYDIERVEKCVIHYATPDDKIVPFCAFNVLPELYRDKSQKMFSASP
ncbi:MAG: radical SAM protein, partial [Chloroflexi bacterium]|nr:radical SAM protein [Chloroflexota bacterium]